MPRNVCLHPQIDLDYIGKGNSVLYDLGWLLLVHFWAEIQGRMFLNRSKPFQVESSGKSRLLHDSFTFQTPTASALAGKCFLVQADPSSNKQVEFCTL